MTSPQGLPVTGSSVVSVVLISRVNYKSYSSLSVALDLHLLGTLSPLAS